MHRTNEFAYLLKIKFLIYLNERYVNENQSLLEEVCQRYSYLKIDYSHFSHMSVYKDNNNNNNKIYRFSFLDENKKKIKERQCQ